MSAGLFDIFTNKNAQDAANAQIQGIDKGLGELSSSFGAGRDALTTNYTAGLQPFLSNVTTGKAGTDALGNALGLNGQAGNDAAKTAFKNNPGFQFQLDTGTENVLRNQARTGQGSTGLASGNTNVDLTNYSQGLAGTSWNNYVNQLSPFLNYSQGAASGVLSGYGGLGQGLNANYTNLGNAQYGGATSAGNAQANADLANNTASANMWGAAGQGLKLASSAAGFLSDERAKEDIEQVGELYDHQPIYRYRYKGDPRHQIGLIAQEVEETEPEAVFDYGVGDLKAVDYKRATDFAADLAGFL